MPFFPQLCHSYHYHHHFHWCNYYLSLQGDRFFFPLSMGIRVIEKGLGWPYFRYGDALIWLWPRRVVYSIHNWVFPWEQLIYKGQYLCPSDTGIHYSIHVGETTPLWNFCSWSISPSGFQYLILQMSKRSLKEHVHSSLLKLWYRYTHLQL